MNLAEAALSFVQDTQKYAVLYFAKRNLLNGARRAEIIINVVYVASFVSPSGIHPDSFIRAISRLGIDSFVTRQARGEHAGIIGVHIRTRGYIKCIRTLRSIIIQADERAVVLIDKCYIRGTCNLIRIYKTKNDKNSTDPRKQTV